MDYVADYKKLNKKFILKYCLDRILAVVLLVVVSPLFLLVMWAIILDGFLYPENKGSIFYTEPRITQGRVFNIIKFRTITEEAVSWIHQEPESRSITGCKDKTFAGKFILKWYFDELPQIFNIAKGDMSFVGPRPHVISQHEKEIEIGCLYRNIIKTGLLGIPQACKRRPEFAALLEKMARTHKPFDKALCSLDGFYAKKCMEKSVFGILLFDLSIIAQCLGVVVRGGGK